MLKLPKGLKKKKKGKKSKKDQELFTEEELKQYKREHQSKNQQDVESDHTSAGKSEFDQNSSVVETYLPSAGVSTGVGVGATTVSTLGTTTDSSDLPLEGKVEKDDEWSKFKALTAGVDSILHRTQDDLDRIKSTSFYQRLPTTAEKQKQEEEEAQAREAERLEKERLRKLEEEANRDKLAEAVVELSESEEESEEIDDIFNTEYIDAITSGEVQLTVVPDSPEFEVDEGPDPFDTTYAEKLIKGPEVSKRGKKLVSLGSAVQVLTGRVDSAHAVALSGARRKPRKGVQDLLFENEEDAAYVLEEYPVTPEPPVNLLDELVDDIPDIPIDLGASLHLPILVQQNKEQEERNTEEEHDSTNQFNSADIVSEFDILKADEDDEFAELAVESLAKKEEIKLINNPQIELSGPVEADWAEFEQTEEEKELAAKKQQKVKPPRPPPARPTTGPHIPVDLNPVLSDDDFEIPEDDPFDTAFVEKVITAKDSDDDFDFDPRAGEEKPTNQNLLSCAQKDLLGGSVTDLSVLPQVPIVPVQESVEDFDPFDTSAILSLVEPKELELKFLEKELLEDHPLKKSLSDPDFDPREGEKEPLKHQNVVVTEFDSARRKSSLSLSFQPKSVGFVVPETDLLAVDNETGKIQKPLTPYYAKPESIQEKEVEDPFDTSFVPSTQPSSVELRHIEKDLLSTNLTHSLSDPDFDPRAFDLAEPKIEQSDLLSVEENINIKVLTPAHENKSNTIDDFSDPFDTSIAHNLQPGKTELKLLENELLPPTKPEIITGVLDTLTDAQELGLGDKVLTPQVPISASESIEEIDPFDTSFAENLGPGKTEIKLLENELIEK